MSELLKRLLQGGGYMDEATDGTGGEAAGGDAGAAGEAGADAGTGGAADAGEAAAGIAQTPAAVPKEVSVTDMAAAITDGLARGPDGRFVAKDGAADPTKPVEGAQPGAKADPLKPAADAGTVAADAAKAKAAADAKALEGKTADDFALTPEMKQVLKKDAQERFHGLTALAKAREAEVNELKPRVQALEQAREQILNVFKESHTEPEELGRMLEFNRMIKTQDYPGALKIVEAYRAQLYKVMGQEAPGVDLVSEFPDINARVDAGELSRQDAVELANARRQAAALQEQNQRHTQHAQSAQQTQQARATALQSIEAWTAQMAKTDPHFAVREKGVATEVAEILKAYPPNLWLSTIQRVYNATSVPAAPARSNLPTGSAPLRPNGTKPGPAKATDMVGAISQGLGYALHE